MDTTLETDDQDLPRPHPRGAAAADPRRARRRRHRAPPPRGSRGRRRRFLPALLRRGRGPRRRCADEKPLEARNDRATAEGLSSPAIQALVDQAAPFADALARARGYRRASAPTRCCRRRAGRAAAPADAGLYGPQPNRVAIEEAVPVAEGYVSRFEPDEDDDDDLIAAPPAAPATRQGPGAPRPATRRRRRAAPRRRRPERRRWPPTSWPRPSPTACRSRSRARSRS